MLFITIIVILFMLLSKLLSDFNMYMRVSSSFECGFNSSQSLHGSPYSGAPLQIAMLYVLFDAELLYILFLPMTNWLMGRLALVLILVILTFVMVYEVYSYVVSWSI